MKKSDELEQLRGIGAVLAKRLRSARLDSFQKIAEAGEEGLKVIDGINLRLVPSIVKQAVELSREAEALARDKVESLAGSAGAVRDRLNSLALGARERFSGKISGKSGRRLGEELVRIADALDRIADRARHPKRARKALAKVQRRMETLDQVGFKKFCKGLKKSRKRLAGSS